MSNTPTLSATFAPPRQRTPLPPKTYATYNNPLENLRYQRTVLHNLAVDYWRDYERERASIRALAVSLGQHGFHVSGRRLAPAALNTPQVRALMAQLFVCQGVVRQSLRGWREARRLGAPLERQLLWEEGEEAAEGGRQRFAKMEGERIVAERRRRKGKGREVVVVVEEGQGPAKRGRVGEASSSRG